VGGLGTAALRVELEADASEEAISAEVTRWMGEFLPPATFSVDYAGRAVDVGWVGVRTERFGALLARLQASPVVRQVKNV
jgi:hypothetical protein